MKQKTKDKNGKKLFTLEIANIIGAVAGGLGYPLTISGCYIYRRGNRVYIRGGEAKWDKHKKEVIDQCIKALKDLK